MNKKVFVLKYLLPPVLILATGAVALRIMLGGSFPFVVTSIPPTGPLSPDEEKIAASFLDAPSQPAVPDDKNAAFAYRKALDLFAAYKNNNPSYIPGDWRAVIGAISPALSAPFTEPIPLAADGAEPPAFLPLYNAASFACNFGADWTMGPFTQIQRLPDMQDLAIWLGVQVRFDMEQRRPERALTHLAVSFGIAGHLSEEPALLSQIYAGSIMNLARRSLMQVAFQMKDDPAFLRDAAALIREHGALRTPPADVITNECSLAVSYYCRLAADPARSADDFTDALREFIEMAQPQFRDVPNDTLGSPPQGSTPYRHWLERALGVPFNSINDSTFRPVVRKMAAFCRTEADILAAAAEENLAASRDAASVFKEKDRTVFRATPEALFARLFLPSTANFPLRFAKDAAENAAAVQVLAALARSSHDTGPVLDAFGAECTVTWFDDLVYIESPSQYVAPHVLDMCFGADVTYEQLSQRLRDLSSSDALLNAPD